MTKTRILSMLMLVWIIASACTEATPVEPTPGVVVESRILISEVLAGVAGNNNFEFIELHNNGDTVVDLQGWSLWYQLESDKEELPIYIWESQVLIPPHGHLLLGRAGQDLGIVVDVEFEQGLVTTKGALELRQHDGDIADALGWGRAPEAFTEGSSAPAMENGVSLERVPGGEQGSGTDTDNNAVDFVFNLSPQPQNTGSPVTPLEEERIAIRLTAPESVEPGETFAYTLTVANEAAVDAQDVIIEFPIPSGLEVVSPPPRVTVEDGVGTWNVVTLEVGEEKSIQITIAAPMNYLTVVFRNYYVFASNLPGVTFGAPVWTRVEGGSLPITVARSLIGDKVAIEGVATMYTGGFYAGSGVKFYLEDESGGVQVYVSGAGGKLDVPLGAQVRVQGTVELYRGSVEIIPGVLEDVEIIDTGEVWPPMVVKLSQAANDSETLPGRLVQVEGTATRIEEFSYSYEIDLIDDKGQLLTLYIDKLTEINAELLEIGKQYRAVGIIEVSDIYQRLNPRLQSDLTQVYPPVLLIEASAPSSVQPGEVFSVTLTAFNHTPETLTDLRIWAFLPVEGALLEDVLNDGELSEGRIDWLVPELASGGASVSLGYKLRAAQEVDQIVTEDYGASAAEWTEPVEGQSLRVFVGSGVPIWAIQGSGFSSPYKLDQVTTSGVVTGVFPELGGFWIQETETDDDPSTSAGLFISTGEMEVNIERDDLVEVYGLVREVYQQTQVQVEVVADVNVIGGGYPLPGAVSLDPPMELAEAEIYYEALEGALVKVPGPAVAVSPTSKYGEYDLVLPYHDIERLYRGDDVGVLITVDDGANIEHYDRSALTYAVGTGDQVSGLVGPLAFTYGRYKIEPIVEPQVATLERELPTLTPIGEGEFSIMTWNVENLFDILEPHPTSPPRPRKTDYELALTKIANTTLAAGAPTVVGLQEVENIGILEDLAMHELLTSYNYQPILVEGTDSRGIDVGYLVRGDRAAVVEVQQHVASEGLTSRPPLLIQVEMQNAHGPVTLYVINNHFTSMAGGEAATEPRRVAQAAWNVTILEGILSDEPQAYIAVIGDLNSYYSSPPIETLRDAGLSHVFEILSEDERYTYIYQGVSQTLDHILVTSSLKDLLLRVEVLHMDADYPPPEIGDDSPEHKSDHDPVIAIFSLAP